MRLPRDQLSVLSQARWAAAGFGRAACIFAAGPAFLNWRAQAQGPAVAAGPSCAGSCCRGAWPGPESLCSVLSPRAQKGLLACASGEDRQLGGVPGR